MIAPAKCDRFLPALTSPEIRDLPDKDRAVVVRPVASIEQHTPHPA
jgi:creatinine amidohydrolase/Fe(II)-dependent formamide hydrolase-like protein